MGETAELTSLRLRMPATKCRHEGKNLPKWLCEPAHNQFRQKKAGISREAAEPVKLRISTKQVWEPPGPKARRVPKSTTCPARGDLSAVDLRRHAQSLTGRKRHFTN